MKYLIVEDGRLHIRRSSAKAGDIDMFSKESTGKAPMKQLNYGAATIIGYNSGHFPDQCFLHFPKWHWPMKNTSPLRHQAFGLGIGISL